MYHSQANIDVLNSTNLDLHRYTKPVNLLLPVNDGSVQRMYKRSYSSRTNMFSE